MEVRIHVLKKKLVVKDLDAFLVTNLKNVYYFSGFLDVPGTNLSLLIPLDGSPILWVPPLSYSAARESARDCLIEQIQRKDLITKVLPVLRRFRSIGFDDLPFAQYQNLTQHLEHTRLIEHQEMVWQLRRIKDEDEITLLKEAARLTDIGAQTGMEFVAKGLKEYEVAAEIEYAMRKRGSDGIAFETVVASGPRSAYPHGTSTNRVIEEGDVVVMDLGAVSSGYRCDITRTVIVGKPRPKQLRILQILMEANEKAFQAIHDGVGAVDVDLLARKIIADSGFGEYFIHGLGHGVGLDIHEPPRLAPDSTDILQKGNVVTDEPGIYLPEFGARIEDTVLVHEARGEKLTQAGYYVI